MIKQKWEVRLARKMEKRVGERRKKQSLPRYIIEILQALMKDIECFGPTLGQNSKHWRNFGPIKGHGIPAGSYHCHLKKGKPTYVACWSEVDKKITIVEVNYVGTHEKAPY